MRRRSLAVLAGLGAAAVGNRVLGRAGGELAPALPGDQQTYRWRGMDVAYAELGDEGDPPVVLFHAVGAVGTSREFADVADELASDHHVIAPDLPGYGRSDRPPLSYSASLYEAFVGDFLADVPPSDPAVIASGLTGTFVALAAPEADVGQLVLVCPAEAAERDSLLSRSAVRTPLLGTAVYNGLTSRVGLRTYVAPALFDGEPPGEYLSYLWTTAHQPGARYAPASYLGGHLDPVTDLASALAAVDAPITLVWGRQTIDPALESGRELAATTGSRLIVVDYAKRLPHLEHPQETLVALQSGLAPVAP